MKVKGQTVSEIQVLRALTRASFREFLREFVHIVIPGEFRWNWHLDVMCDQLQVLGENLIAGRPSPDYICNVSPGSTKPVWEKSRISMADGTWKLLRDIVPGDYVIGKSGKSCRVRRIYKQGSLPCVKITTSAGREIIAAHDHPILTADGWTNAGDIRPHQMLALLHSPKIKGTTKRTDDEFRFAGYLIGDGSVSSGNCNVTNKDPEYIDDLVNCVHRLGFGANLSRRRGVTRISFVNGIRGNKRSDGPRHWCKSIGIWGRTSKTKKIPSFVWKGTDDQVRQFLAAYFHCDGCVHYKHGHKRNITIRATTISRSLAKGLQRLFLRLGVSMRFRKYINKSGFAYNRNLQDYTVYHIETSDQDSAVRFLENVPLIGPKARKLKEFQPRRKTFDQAYWPDQVVSVDDCGAKRCRCLSVDRDESFIVDGVVVHNSTVFSVMFPAWMWTRMPHCKFICVSYSHILALNLSRLGRDVVTSDLYKQCFPEIILRDDQSTKTQWANTLGGMRYASGSEGTVTGLHGHCIIIDDPLDPNRAVSEQELANTNYWIKTTLLSRLADKRCGFIALVMQRLAVDDPTDLISKRKNVIWHRIPAIDCGYPITPPELKNRYVNGLMDPIGLNQEFIDATRGPYGMGETGFAGQYGQSPLPTGGGCFKTDRIRWSVPPKKFRKIVRGWDKAVTPGRSDILKGAAFTVGAKIAEDYDGRIWILDVKRARLDSFEREKLIKLTTIQDGYDCTVAIEEEPGSGGKDSAMHTVKSLKGYRVVLLKPTGSKESRAEAFSSAVNGGIVYMSTAERSEGTSTWIGWAADLIEELRHWPHSTFLDQGDALATGYTVLAKGRVRVGAVPKKIGKSAESSGEPVNRYATLKARLDMARLVQLRGSRRHF